MYVEEETWLTTGAAAQLASRDIRTIRRWADAGVVRCRVSPGGRRQVALSSLLDAQPPPNQARTHRAPPTSPVDTIGRWAQVLDDWYGWQPTRTVSTSALESLLLETREVTASMRSIEASVLDELRRRDDTSESEDSHHHADVDPLPAW